MSFFIVIALVDPELILNAFFTVLCRLTNFLGCGTERFFVETFRWLPFSSLVSNQGSVSHDALSLDMVLSSTAPLFCISMSSQMMTVALPG